MLAAVFAGANVGPALNTTAAQYHFCLYGVIHADECLLSLSSLVSYVIRFVISIINSTENITIDKPGNKCKLHTGAHFFHMFIRHNSSRGKNIFISYSATLKRGVQ